MAVDAPEELRAILAAAWTKSNTDERTPRFVKIGDDDVGIRQSVLLATPDSDLVTVYETTAPHEHSGIGSPYYRHTSNLRVDIRTLLQYSHGLKMKEEVLRILFANMAAPAGSFDKLKGPFDVQNLSDKSKRLQRYVITCKLLTHRRTYA